MKNLIKTVLIALTVLSFTSCIFGDKAKNPIDTTTTKIDTTAKVTIDTAKKDTGKMDTAKKM